MHYFQKAALLLMILFSSAGMASAVCLGGFDTITGFPCGGNNAPVGSVTISGTTTEGQTLTATNNITDADGMTGSTITYQWRAKPSPGIFADIAGATGATYALTANDVGMSLDAVASYTDDLGTMESVTSASTATIVAASVNSAPALGGTFTTAGVVNDNATITPFAQVTVTDANAADQVSVAISFIAVNGTLAGTGITGPVITGINAVYTVTAAAQATAQANLQAAIFTPTAGQGR